MKLMPINYKFLIKQMIIQENTNYQNCFKRQKNHQVLEETQYSYRRTEKVAQGLYPIKESGPHCFKVVLLTSNLQGPNDFSIYTTPKPEKREKSPE